MIIVIVESPAKCKKIESFLGSDYKCLASFGHIRELSNGLKCIDFKNNFEPSFNTMDSKGKVIKTLRTMIKKASGVVLATDDDREGEAIAWHICKTFNLPVKTTPRIVFREITKTAVNNAINNPTIINMNKVNSQLARQVLDRVVGFTISPKLWKHISRKTKSSLSAGRCQTPALRVIYDNQKEINESLGTEYYSTTGIFGPLKLEYSLNHEFTNKDDVETFLEESAEWEHEMLEPKITKDKIKKPPSPLTTSKLQQKASNVLHYSPKQTMMLAQKLYEGGYITYMRTDSTTYSKEFITKAKKFIKGKWGNDFISKNINNLTLRKGKGQEAHEAIRPTKITLTGLPGNADPRQKKLYSLIWSNTCESCMANAIYDIIKSIISAAQKHKFTKTEQKITFPGWLVVNGFNSDNKIYAFLEETRGQVQMIKINSNLQIKNLKSHLTEARLIQLLEQKGIGRPSTFSGLVSKILEREYVKKTDVPGSKLECIDFELSNDEITEIETIKTFGSEKNKLVIQPIGILVSEFLDKYYSELLNYDYTSFMEKELDIISKGDKIWYDLCEECYQQLKKLDSKIKGKRETIKIDDDHTYMIGRYGPVIKYEKAGETKFIPVKEDIDFEKLKRGEYTLDEIKKEKNYGGKVLGLFKENPVILKSGQFGLYVNWNNKNYSLKGIKKDEEDIILSDVIEVLLGKKLKTNPNILLEIDEYFTIRKGKYGPYIFYKKENMSKPMFLSLKNKKDWKKSSNKELRDWIKMEHNI